MPSREEIQEIEKTFGVGGAAGRKQLHALEQMAAKAGVGGQTQLHTTSTGIISLWQPSSDGCEACHHSGFRGFIAITEALPIQGTRLQTALLNSMQPHAIEFSALKEGFIPMRIDGLVKALRGQTTISEVLRIGVV